MSRGPIANCPILLAEHLPLLTRLGCQAFGEQGPEKYGLRRSQYYQRLYEHNPHIFRLVLNDSNQVTDDDNAAGFLSVIPTAKSVYKKFSTGLLSQFEFSRKHILPADFNGPCDVYLQTLYLHPDCQNQARRLLTGLMRSIANLSNGGVDGSGPGGGVRIYAEATSEAGESIMKIFNMKPEGRSKEGNPVLVIHTCPENPLMINTPHKILNRHLQRYVNGEC